MNLATHNPSDGDQVLSVTVPEACAGLRTDQALSGLIDNVSRSTIQGWLRQGRVTEDGVALNQRHKLNGGELLQVCMPPAEDAQAWLPEPVPVNIVYEDADVRVINKPAGLVVHPGAGNRNGTLANGLLALDNGLRALPRGGIVHRLDKDTSGLMVSARSEAARLGLIEQLASRSLTREYFCVVYGAVISGGTIDKPIGRSRRDRTRMAVTTDGKRAITHYRVHERFRAHTSLSVKLETGRTHQIRVHMMTLRHPIVGDPVYRDARFSPIGTSAVRQSMNRQALHAYKIEFVHPVSGETLAFECPLPVDIIQLVDRLRTATGDTR
jgi:23S rRNA pseudouridine1911/1915/1917 synthase